MSDKQRWPRAYAQHVAELLTVELGPACARLQIAGSLRRKKHSVGDIELVYVPRIERRTDTSTLFPEEITVNCADEVINRWERDGVLRRRLNINGSETFGEKIKLMLHVDSSVPVDLFSTTEESWWNYLVCRTGPAESNVAIAEAARAKGWEWKPYSPGFYRIGHTEIMHSERAVFDFVGLPYNEPERRI